MSRHDPDAIAALAEGRLDSEEAATLEREISADPVAAAELVAHRTALKEMAEASRYELSTSERLALRSAVADAIGIAVPEPVAERNARRVPWGSLGIAASAVVGLIAIVPLVGLLSTGGGDETAALELPPETSTTAPAPELEEQRSAAVDPAAETELVAAVGADENDGLMPGGDTSNDAATFGSSTTLPPATTAVLPPQTTTSPAATEASPMTSVAESNASEGANRLTAELENIRDEITSGTATVGEFAAPATEETSCSAEDIEFRTDSPPERYFFEYQDDDVIVIVYFALTGDELGPFQVWAIPDCANLAVIP